MLRKTSIVLSFFAAVGLAVASPANAEVKKKVEVKKNVTVNRTVTVNRNVSRDVKVNREVKVNRDVNRNVRVGSTKFVVGKKYNGHPWYGHSRHRWHGTWYAYGDGPCWINIDGEWFWNELACPE